MAPTNGTDSTKKKEGTWDGAEDYLEPVFTHFLMDEYGNMPVTNLAQAAQVSATCKSWVRLVRDRKTIYDAKIRFDNNNDEEKGLPVCFVGGVSFGEFRFFPALCIIRHPKNGRMFCVSVKPNSGFMNFGPDWYGPDYTDAEWNHPDPNYLLNHSRSRFEVHRIYKIGELAGLLNGHCADFSRRLPELNTMQYMSSGEYQQLCGRTLDLNWRDAVPAHYRGDDEPKLVFKEQKRVATGAQLVTKSVDPSDGSLKTHLDDYITWGVEWGDHQYTTENGSVRSIRKYTQTGTLVLLETVEQEPGEPEPLNGPAKKAKYILPGKAWVGPNQIGLRVNKALEEDLSDLAPHQPLVLPILLGQMSCAKQGTGPSPGWWPSIFLGHQHGALQEAINKKQRGSNFRVTKADRTLLNKAQGFREWHHLGTTENTLVLMGKMAMDAHGYMQDMANTSVGATSGRGRLSRSAKEDAKSRLDRMNSVRSDETGRLLPTAETTAEDIKYDGQFAKSSDIASFAKKQAHEKGDSAYVQSAKAADNYESEDEDEDEDYAYDDSVEEVGTKPKKRRTNKHYRKPKPKRKPKPEPEPESASDPIDDLSALIDSFDA